MKAFAFALSLLAAGASAALTRSRGGHEGGRQRLASGSLRSINTRTDPVPPPDLVHDVVGTLQGFLQNLQEDQAADEEISKEWICLCKNDTNMQEEIDALDASIATLTSTMAEQQALIDKLGPEVTKLEGDVAAKAQEIVDLDSANDTASTEFAGNAAELTSDIQALEQAIGALSQHNQGALLQAPKTLRQVASMIQHRLREHPSELALSPEQEEMVSLLSHGEVPDTYWNDYQNQSGEVFGILKQLHEGFESDLDEATTQNDKRIEDYVKLRSALATQLENLNTVKEAKVILKGDTEGALGLATTSKSDAERTKLARQGDLDTLRASCQDYNDKYPVRMKTREDEIAAVTEAISILDSHPAYTAFKHHDIDFLQERARSVSKGGRGWLLNGRVHPFPEVKYAIQKLIQDIEEEDETEEAQHGKCDTETQKRQEAIQSTQGEITDLNGAIGVLTETLDGDPDSEVEPPHTDAGARANLNYYSNLLVEDQQALKAMSEERAKDGMRFLTEMAHLTEAKTALKKAIEALKAFYNGEQANPDMTSGHGEVEGFETYENQEDKRMGNGEDETVVALLQKILDHAEDMETEEKRQERDAQVLYKNNAEARGTDIIDGAREKQEYQTAVVDTELDLESKDAELALANTRLTAETQAKAKLDESCTFLLENFSKRHTSRMNEIEGLKEVIEILEGA